VDPSDGDLVDRSRRGDREAFEALYRRHRDWVVSLAFRFCGNREDALDVLQETFLYVFRKLPRLELTSRFTTFLYPAVKHLALGRKRALRRLAPLPEEEPAGTAHLAPDVRELIAGATPLQQEVLLLRFADGLDLAEIAEALRVPLGTVKSRLHNAIEALRKKVRGE
jgi:RNA polymerase sigma-70 factor (ECF subfamily)